MKVNVKRVLLCSAILLGNSLAFAVPASAQPEGADIMYHRTYYSDNTFTTEVGYEDDTCHSYGVGGGQTHGIETDYYTSDPIAYCYQGNLYPY